MTTAKNPTSSRTGAARSAKAAAGAQAEAATEPEKETPAPATAGGDQEHGRTVSVTIPLDSALVGAAVRAATLPVTAARKVAQNKNGLPAYLAVGGLAVVGAVEWPVAAATGLGLAAMRRWGPLKPDAGQNGRASNGTTSE